MKDKLLKIQNELKAPKNQKNTFGGYNYRSCEDIFEAVKPLLTKENLLLRMNDELVQIGDRYYIKATAILTDGNEVIENTAYAREEENKKGMDGSQITGASSSYARKYALNGLFLIDDVKDSDATNTGEEKEITIEEAKKYKITFGQYKGMTLEEIKEDDEEYLDWLWKNAKEKKVKEMTKMVLNNNEKNEKLTLFGEIEDLIMQTKTDYENMLKHYGVESNADMTIEQLRDAKSELEKKLRKQNIENLNIPKEN